MTASGLDGKEHFVLAGTTISATSARACDLIKNHFFGKLSINGCEGIDLDGDELALLFADSATALIAQHNLESLARLDDQHLLTELAALSEKQAK